METVIDLTVEHGEHTVVVNMEPSQRDVNVTVEQVQRTVDVTILGEGPQGIHGEDGYSPAVTVTEITGGHRVTITDADGDHAFNVMDGQDGASSWDELQSKPFERLGDTLKVENGTLDINIYETGNPSGGNTLYIGG